MQRSELRRKLLDWAKACGVALSESDSEELADRLVDLVVGWLNSAPQDEDTFLDKTTKAIIREFSERTIPRVRAADVRERPRLTPDEFLDTVLVPEKSSDHICWRCKHLKPVLKGSSFPPADLIGWCMKIHWPFYWCVTEANVVKRCYAFEAKEVRAVAGVARGVAS